MGIVFWWDLGQGNKECCFQLVLVRNLLGKMKIMEIFSKWCGKIHLGSCLVCIAEVRDTGGDGDQGKILYYLKLFETIKGFRFYWIFSDHVLQGPDYFYHPSRTNFLVESAITFLGSAKVVRSRRPQWIIHCLERVINLFDIMDLLGKGMTEKYRCIG